LKSDFPRVYRQTRGYRASMYACGIFLAIAALAGAGYALTMDDQASGVPAMLVVLCVLVGIGGAAMIAGGARTRVVLHENEIEVFGIYRESRLSRAEISGMRVFGAGQGVATIKLLPRYSSGAPLSLPPSLAMDAEFHAWFTGIDDLEAQDRQASVDRYLKDESEPGSPEEKWQRLRTTSRVAQRLTWLMVAAFAWSIFYPHPYRLVILTLALLPWVSVALAAFRGNIYRLDSYRNDLVVNVGGAMTLPGFALTLRALFDVQVLDGYLAALLTIGGAVGCMGLILMFVDEMRGHRGSQLSLLLLMCTYSYGVVMFANKQLDSGEPVSYTVPVLDKRISTGQGITRYLRVGPWGPRKEAEEVEVGSDMYEVAVGEQVCVYVYPGALRMRWYEVWTCPRNEPGARELSLPRPPRAVPCRSRTPPRSSGRTTW
jgi:hypothetical protein